MSRFLWGMLILPLVCGLGSYAWVTAQERGVMAERDRLRKMGVPTSPDELRQALKPAGANAAPLYVSLFQEIESGAYGPPERFENAATALARLGSPKQSASERNRARRALIEFRPLYPKLERIAERPDCIFDREWEQGPTLLFPELAKQKRLVRVLVGKAKSHAEMGDAQGATRALRQADAVAAHSGSDPILIGLLVGVNGRRVTLQATQEVLRSFCRDALALAHVKRAIDHYRPLPSLRRALYGEVLYARSLRERPDKWLLGNEGSISRRALAMARVPQMRPALERKLLATWRRAFERLPADERHWQGVRDAMVQTEREVMLDDSPSGEVVQYLFPMFSHAAEAYGEAVAEERLAKVGVRLLMEQAQYGRLPDQLPNWGEMTTDPFTGRPLAYRRKGGSGFVLYSVGRDRTDNGGTPRTPKTRGKGHDLVWAFE